MTVWAELTRYQIADNVKSPSKHALSELSTPAHLPDFALATADVDRFRHLRTN